jgi:hypothetical protein
VWYPVSRAPIPAEPGRDVVIARVQQARRQRGRRTAGDDRLETGVYAVKRMLWRLGHGQRTGTYACSVDQLVAGLGPRVGWGPPPPRDSPGRRAYFRRHRASLQRWLDWLQAAHLIRYHGDLDEHGYWWRTTVELLPPPPVDVEDLARARERMKGWTARDARRRGRACPPRRSLQAIRRHAQQPGGHARRQLALERAQQVHEGRRRRAVDAALDVSADSRESHKKDLRHPYGAPPTSVHHLVALEALTTSEPSSASPVPTITEGSAFAAHAGAHAHEASPNPPTLLTPPERHRETTSAPLSAAGHGFDPAAVLAAVSDGEQRFAARRGLCAQHLARRAAEIAAWPAARPCPWGRLREAWAVFRDGALAVGDTGPRPTVGPEPPDLPRRAARAIALYDTHHAQRPPGWPASGTGALLALASQRHAATLAGDVARLRVLARRMRALAGHADPHRLERARRRAEDRDRADRWQSRLLGWRLAGRPRIVSPEHRRRQDRDEQLLAGLHPWADGLTQLAGRYRDELAHGAWTLPAHWPNPTAPPENTACS